MKTKAKKAKSRAESRKSSEPETPRVVAHPEVMPKGPAQMPLAVLQQIGVAQLQPSPTNPRKDFAGIEELAANLKTHGILQPLVVRLIPANRFPARNHYEIVCGERRYRAAKVAGLKAVPCLVRPLTDGEVIELQIIENLQRADLSPLEEAESYRALLKTGLKVTDLEGRLNKSRSHIFGMLRLTRLSGPVRAALVAGKISASVAGLIAQVAGEKAQKQLLQEAVHTGWDGEPTSFREMKGMVERQQKDLRKAPWRGAEIKLQDQTTTGQWAELAKCARCAGCPKRSGNLPAELAEGLSPDVCTDTECYATKTKAWGADYQRAAAKEGKQVFVGEEASSRWHSGNFIEAGEKDWDTGKQVSTLVKEAAKAGRVIAPVVLVRENGETKTVYARASLRAAEPKEKREQRKAEAAAPSAFEAEAARVKLALAQKLAEGPQGVELLRTLLEVVVCVGWYALFLRNWWEENGRRVLGVGKTKESLSWTEAGKLRAPQEWVRLYVRDELNVAGAQGLDQEVVAMRRQLYEWLLPDVHKYGDDRNEAALEDWCQRWGVKCELPEE